MKKIKLFEEFNSSNVSLNEAFEVHYSDGVRAMKKFGSEKQAIDFAKDLIKNKKSLQFVDVFNTGSGFHSTADTNAIVAFWGNGSYTDNVSKKDPKLAAKKIEESLVFEAKAKGLDWVISELGDKPECMDVAEFVYNNYDKVTGLRKSMRNDEMDFPDEIMDVVDHYGLDIDKFTDCYGMAAESIMTEGVVSIKGGRIIAHKVLNKLVDMGLIPVKKKSEDLLETIAEVITNAKMESVEVNEGAIKQFEVDYTDMEKSIKRGIGWIDPEYTEETWENSSNAVDFQLVKDEIYKRLIKAGLLWHSDESGEEKGKQVKSLKELGIKESVINEAFDVKVGLRHTKDAIALFNDMFMKYGKRPSTDVFSFKEKDAAIDFVQMLVKNLQIPMGEIEADKDIIKNLK